MLGPSSGANAGLAKPPHVFHFYNYWHENRRHLLLKCNKNLAHPPTHPYNPRPFSLDSLNRKEVPMMRTSTTDITPCNHNA